MTESRTDQSWELIAKSMLMLLALAIVGGFAFYQGTKYCHGGPQPMPTPWPTPAPDPDFWYTPSASVLRCLPTQVKICDGIPRHGWYWVMSQRGRLMFREPGWREDGATEDPPQEMPAELFRELQQGNITQPPPPEPTPDPNT